MTPKPPSPRQLNYLKALAKRTGQTFAYPHTSAEASAEIRRLKAVKPTGFTFAANSRPSRPPARPTATYR